MDSLIVEQAPEEGEDFQAIADDYQKLVVPGEWLIKYGPGWRLKLQHRIDNLAASILFRLLPDGVYIRGYTWRTIRFEYSQSWLQRAHHCIFLC